MTQILNLASRIDYRKQLRLNMTEAEKKLWKHIRKRQLRNIKFRRQYSVGVYILDFYAPEIHIGIELDGEIHIGREEYDQERTCYLKSLGITIIRYKNSDILEKIDFVLQHLKKQIPPPYEGGG